MLLCADCHKERHRTQTWDSDPLYLYGSLEPVTSIKSRGVEHTYDLEIAGEFPNFLANGIVVHNSRDSASSRAVPTIKILEQVRNDPYLPPQWQYRQRGMQPAGPMDAIDANTMTTIEESLRKSVLSYVKAMNNIKAAKEDINRYLEPWMWTTIVATATEWDNYFALRAHGDAQAAHAMLAHAMQAAYAESMPVLRHPVYYRAAIDDMRPSWHLPYVSDEERVAVDDWRHLPLISAARCAGVSYFRQGAREDRSITDEVNRALELVRKRHWSPTEMACQVWPIAGEWHGPYFEWKPLRKFYGGESGSPHHGTQEDAPWVLR